MPRQSRTRTHLHRPRPFGAVLFVAIMLAGLLPAPPAARAEELSPGTYRMNASVFGSAADGLVGQWTSGGHKVLPYDRLVALPGCTQSNCPKVPVGSGKEHRLGPQTSCAEPDGLCWVAVTAIATNRCVVAPVRDLGPFFIKDNWWSDRPNRNYDFPRGIPAVEAALQGEDLGYGPGKSDVGHDLPAWGSNASIDLTEGLWIDLGLPINRGRSDVVVQLLWQTGIHHMNACNGKAGNATTLAYSHLRAGPSTTDSVLTTLQPDRRVTVSGAARSGFYQVDVDGYRGWIAAELIQFDGVDPGTPLAAVTTSLNFRSGPSTGDAVIRVAQAGSVVAVTGPMQNGFLPVRLHDVEGWMFAEYLDRGTGLPAPPTPTPTPSPTPSPAPAPVTARTTDDLNLRAGPGTGRRVLAVIPTGAEVTLTGAARNGFMRVRYGTLTGWAFAAYLATSDGVPTARTTTDALNLRAGPSTSNRVLLVIPAGATVTLSGQSQGGFVSVVYNGKAGWVSAAYLR